MLTKKERVRELERELRLLRQSDETQAEMPSPGEADECGKMPGPAMQGMAMRESGPSRLRSIANSLRRRADQIDALAAVLPANLHALSQEADAALWELAAALRV